MSEWNGRPILCGQSDPPLSDWGRRQAEAVAKRLRGRSYDALVASDLGRTMQTAEPIADALGLLPEPDTRWRELFIGKLEGRSMESLDRDWPAFRDKWQKTPGSIRFPGGESMRDVAVRVWDALEDLYEQYPDGNIVVVSHRFAIAVLCCRALRVSVGRFRQFVVDNASLSQLEVGQEFRLLTLNDVAHLESMIGAPHKLEGALPPKIVTST